MKIAAVVGVKDERDLIQPCLERLWAVGVGPILVLDDHSTDGTLDIVQSVSRMSGSPLEYMTFNPDFDRNMQVQGEVFAPFLGRHSPDWLVCIDADEFILCADDDLPSTLPEEDGAVVAIERFNVPLTTDPFVPTVETTAADFARAHVITGREVLNRSLLDEDPGRRWIMHRIDPKLAVRTGRVAQYGLGWHSVADASGQPITAIPARGIVIAHVPLTTQERFARKVANARDFFRRWANHYPGDAAWHWKRWVDLADRGLLGEEFEAQRMDIDTIVRLTDMGVLQTAGAAIEKSLEGTL